MPEWITANWIWLVLALGAGWFLLRRGGAGCGMGGHGSRHGAAPRGKGLDTGPPAANGDRREARTKEAASTGATRRRGGCC